MAPHSTRSLYGRLPIALQNVLVAVAGWRSYRVRFGPEFRRLLEDLKRLDFNSDSQVRDDQNRRLRDIVRWAATSVPYYRDLFRREGIDPETIRTVDDLTRIPPLDKDVLRVDPASLLSEVVKRRRLVPGQTSGTTGSAISLWYTREALAWEYAVNWRQRGWYGIRPGTRYAAFGGQTIVPFSQVEPPFWRFDPQRQRMLFSLYHMKPAHLEAFARELAQPGYGFWQGYPSAISLVCAWMLEHDFGLEEAAPKAVFTSSETLLAHQREKIERATRAPVADRYGHAEFAASVLTCPVGSYHVDTEFCAIEIDPRESGDGWVRGEILATGFCNRAMPLIRYRTGDLATLRTDGRCKCGRNRPILEAIDGRIEDYVVTPDGRWVGRMDHVFKEARSIREAQIVQRSPDRIELRFVPAAGFDDDTKLRLERELRLRLGPEMAIDWQPMGAIPRLPSGKFRAVVSELPSSKVDAPG